MYALFPFCTKEFGNISFCYYRKAVSKDSINSYYCLPQNWISQPISIEYKWCVALIKLCLEPKTSKCSLSCVCPVFHYVLEQVSNVTLSEKLDFLCNWKSEISYVCNVVEVHCFQAMKIVHDYANGCSDWLVSGQQSVNSSREAVSNRLYCLENTKDWRLSILWFSVEWRVRF